MVVSFIVNLLTGGISGLLVNMLNDVLALFAGVVAQEHATAMRLLDTAFVVGAIRVAQAVAGSLLALKISVEVLKSYILFASGSSDAHPAKLVKRAMFAAAMIAGSPWLARNVFGWGGALAVEVSQIPAVGEVTMPVWEIPVVGIGFGMIFAIGTMMVFWVLIFIQSIIRGVEVAFLSVAGPIMAVGLTGADEGAWAVWWRELVVVSLSQAVQMLMLTGFFAAIGEQVFRSGATPNFHIILTGIAWLWVAHKSPAVLKQFAYHTGTGSLASGASRAGSMLVKTIAKKR